MLGFNYDKFKAAIKRAELKKFEELKIDINNVKAVIEKMLIALFENSSARAKSYYPGIDI